PGMTVPSIALKSACRITANMRDMRAGGPAANGAASLFQFLNARLRDVAVRPSLEVGIETVGIVHDRLAGLEAWHPFVQPSLGNDLDEIFLAERLHTFKKRRPNESLLVGTVTAVTCGGTPGSKAVHRVWIDLDAIDDFIRRGGRCRACFVLRGCGQCGDGAACHDQHRQRS